MKLPESYTIVHRNVRHVRISVDRLQRVQIVVPYHLPEAVLEEILRKKEQWIQKHLKRFRSAAPPIAVGENELLLRGMIFRIDIREDMRSRIVVDRENGTIRAGTGFRSPVIRLRWYRKAAEEYFHPRVAELATVHGFQYSKVTLRRQKSRWGSCSKKKAISLNARLIKAPDAVSDYVILHELAHTEHMNHSREYWRRVQGLCPDYRGAIRWLRDHGGEL
jgi:predicted metal-dependent hydrolase